MLSHRPYRIYRMDNTVKVEPPQSISLSSSPARANCLPVKDRLLRLTNELGGYGMRWGWRLTAVLAVAAIGCSRGPTIADGTYYGYESMANLSPEDPDAYWYHENEFTVEGGRVHVEGHPRTLVNGQVFASASDGGFPVLEGSIEQVAGRTLVALRKISCDYCGNLVDDPLPSKKRREYVVFFEPDGAFEVDRVMYRLEPNVRLHWVPRDAPVTPDP
jgi:hypothetical protein